MNISAKELLQSPGKASMLVNISALHSLIKTIQQQDRTIKELKSQIYDFEIVFAESSIIEADLEQKIDQLQSRIRELESTTFKIRTVSSIDLSDILS